MSDYPLLLKNNNLKVVFVCLFSLFGVYNLLGQTTFADDFNGLAYDYPDNSGTLNFSGPWIETGDDGSSFSGNIYVSIGERLVFNGISSGQYIERELDLSAYTNNPVTLTLNHFANLTGGRKLGVQISPDGTIGSWTTIGSFSNLGSVTHTLTAAQKTATTHIRFFKNDNKTWTLNSDFAEVDDVVFTVGFNVNDDVNSVSASNTGTITGNVLTNDGGIATVTEVDVYPAMVGNTYTTLYGSITIQSDGSYVYDVDETNVSVLGLKSGASLDDILSYTAEDSDGTTDYGILIITINGVDDLPNAVDDADSILACQEYSTFGNVILDDTGGSPDTVDRGLSKLVWENEGFGASNVGGQTRTIDGVDLTFTSSDPDNIGVAGVNHVVSTAANGGHTGYLMFRADPSTLGPNQDIVLTIDFDEPVYNLGFLLVDLDNFSNVWQDLFRIEGSLDGVASTYVYTHTGGVVDAGSNTFYGVGSAISSDATGNVNVFFEEPINQLKISYNEGPDVTFSDPEPILGGLSDVHWQSATSVIEITQVDGNAANVGVEYAGTYGTVVINSDGSYEYIPDLTNENVVNLLVGETLTETFNYTLSDSFNTDTANLVITINGTGTDFDNDGIADKVDLDDDNDGILDVDECSGSISAMQFTGLSSTAQNYSISGTNVTQSATGTVDGANTDNNGNLALGSNGASTSISVSAASSFTISAATNTARDFDSGDQWTLSSSTGSFFISDPSDELNIISNTGNTIIFSTSGGVNPLNWSIKISDVSDLTLTMDNGNPYSDLNVLITVPCIDTDSDTTPDHLDTDSDNDGCPDAIEGDGSFMISDLVDPGTDDSFGDTVNTNGIPTIVTGGDTTGTETTGQATTVAVTDSSENTACKIDLSLTKKVDNALPKVGDTITYTLTVTNNGPQNATGVNVTDVLPAGLTYMSDDSGTTSTSYDDLVADPENKKDTWVIGNLNVNQTLILKVTARVDQAGTIINTAEITNSNQTDIDSTPGNGG